MPVSGTEKLQERIGYRFEDPTLLEQAVTHRSYSNANNERLEFLGDAILNFVIASALFERFPDATEGQLSRLRARLGKRPTLANVARELNLGEQLIMGGGELKSGGFNRDSILSDALEAILGAMLLDAGAAVTSERIVALFESRLDELSLSNVHKDAKSRLQEFLQGRGKALPDYVLVKTSGKSPHQEFEVECRSGELTQAVSARGTSRRKAEQAAAQRALDLLESGL